MRYVVGIDPGFRETGLALSRVDDLDHFTMLGWVTLSSPPDDADTLRAIAMADQVLMEILGWINTYKITELDVVIELPVYNHSAVTYTKQVRLLEEIQARLYQLLPSGVQATMTEVYPATSKAYLTGDARAKKNAMVAVLYKQQAHMFGNVVLGTHTAETIADAYAHSLCFGHGDRVYELGTQAPDVEVKSRGTENTP
jgi:Holliday junction resolvasome RuvABC endonuclease subunit